MALILKDRVKVTSGVIGTGSVTLGTAAVGYQDFSAIGNGNVTYYTIALLSGSEWEVGQGTVTQVTGTWYLSRDVVLESSNAGNLVNFSTGTKDVFVTYPAEKAIFEEPAGNVVFDGGPITVVGNGVTSYTSFANFFAEMFGNANTYVQAYIQNQNGGSDASADYVALNDIGTDTTYYVDMGMNSSGYTSGTFQIYTPNSGYVYSIGGGSTSKMFVGSADDDLILHAGGFATTNIGLTISGTDQTVDIAKDAIVGGTLSVTGAADFASTVLLSANPTLALQAATKQYVDNQVSAGLHIHEPVLVETTGNLNATYARAGSTNINITGIANGTDVSFFGTVAVNDQVYVDTAVNGLLAYTAYFIVNVLSPGVAQVSLTFGGAIVTGLTNGSFTQPAVINSGVGATLTNAGAQAALSIDNVPLALTNRVMVRLQTNAAENGVYTVTTVGTGATNWELTRATDSNKVNPADPNGVGTGDYYYTQDGDINAGDSHVLTTEPNTMIIGYTGLTYTQFSGAVTYTGVAPIDVTGQTISLTGIVAAINGGTGTGTVTTGNLLYGSATDTWSKLAIGAAYRSLVVNAGGTNVEWNAIALNQAGAVSGALPIANGGTNLTTYLRGDLIYGSATNTLAKLAGNITATKQFLTQTGTGAISAAPAWGTIAAADVSGLAASATTDTTDATNIISGTLPIARLNGSYTGVTGVGALAAGSLATGFTTVSAPLGGTGQSSYAVGDLLYASTTTALSKLADVVTGNALISGGVGAAPAWGKVGLTTHVSGTLAVANGGTGAATLAGYVYGNGTGAMTASTSIPNAATTATSANTASTIVARDASGNFTAGTITAALNGNATTATTAANVNNGTLSLAVSGTGLSGSATFTANQSGNSTFTVASNATSANTASTIVARDASGNFTAGTITAALSGNATSATSATNATNATNAANLSTGTSIKRTVAGAGWLDGMYSGVESTGTSGAIYSIGGVYVPGTTTLGNMYGIGYGYSGNAGITATSAPVNLWGMYVASGGVSRIFLDADNGRGFFNGAVYSGGTVLTGNTGTVTSVGGTGSYGGLTLSGTVTTSGNLTFGGTPTGTWPISVTGNAATITSQANSATITASTAATASQIVLRDGSGDDNRRYGFAEYFNMSHGVSGTTTDSIFYSSGDNYIRKNNATGFRASLNVPTRTGGDASGTWGISVTGNAATATSATSATSATFLNSSNYINQRGSQGSWNADFQATAAGAMSYGGDVGANGVNGPGGSWWIQENFRHSNSSNYWGTQVAWGWEDNANRLATRNVTSGTYGGWVYYLNSSNYNSYSPTLTGGGASGTWGINVTGTSNNITAYTINQSVGTGDAPTFGEVYTNGWFRNNTSNTGLYSTSTTQHWSSQANGYWDASSTTSVSGIRFYTGGHVTSLRGYVYADNGNNIGFLNSAGSWSLKMDNSGNATATGTIAASNFSGSSSGTNTGDQTNISGNAGTATTASTTTMSAGRSDSTAYPVVWGTQGATSQLYSCAAVNITSSNGTLNASTFIVGSGTRYAWSASSGYYVTQIGSTSFIANQGVGNLTEIGTLYYSSSSGSFLTGNGTPTRYAQSSGAHIFSRGSGNVTGGGTTFTEQMRVDSNNNLLIGASSGSGGGEKLYITGSVANNIVRFINSSPSAYGPLFQYATGIDPNGTGNEFIDCRANGTTLRFNVRSNGGITNYQANNVNLSDRREKINFAPAGEYLSKICAIPVQTFNYIDQNMEEDGGLTLGVIAQDVQAVAPELVAESNWGTQDEPKQRLSIYQTDLQYALMKCIQEQQAIIESLKARLTAAGI